MAVSTKTLHIAPTLFNDEIEITLDADKTGQNSVLEILQANNVSINHSCGGNATCGTCRVKILKGQSNLSTPSEVELEMAAELQIEKGVRLSCQTQILGDVSIQIVNKPIED